MQQRGAISLVLMRARLQLSEALKKKSTVYLLLREFGIEKLLDLNWS